MTNINKTYADGTHALKNVSLELPAGMVGLLGPNGAGKSSLMRTLACLQGVDEGQLSFSGIDISQQPEAIRRQLGYLPQDFGAYPHMSCVALLKHIATLKGLSKKSQQRQIPELLALTNLSNVGRKSVASFSGGMRQRFGIAQALLGDPSLVILDEPTSGLDPRERERLNELLVTLSESRLILLSTHIVEDIEDLCTHVAFLYDGQVAASDSVPNLLAPLKGCVWQTQQPPNSWPNATRLSKRFRHGEAYYRLFSPVPPTDDAQVCSPTLQDRYFLELSKKGSSYDIAK
jgi:ABC-type multidrug transport system ATPase subunit